MNTKTYDTIPEEVERNLAEDVASLEAKELLLSYALFVFYRDGKITQVGNCSLREFEVILDKVAQQLFNAGGRITITDENEFMFEDRRSNRQRFTYQ